MDYDGAMLFVSLPNSSNVLPEKVRDPARRDMRISLPPRTQAL
jgi:hypothetical protein